MDEHNQNEKQNEKEQDEIQNPIKVWIQDKLKQGSSSSSDFQSHWEYLMEPILDSFCNHYQHIKVYGKKNPATVEKLESWIKKKKQKKSIE